MIPDIPPRPEVSDRRAQRRLLRARRAGMSAAHRQAASRAIRNHIAASRWLSHAGRIGLYASVPPEVDTGALRLLARQRHCRIYLPRIVNYRQHLMQWYPDDGAATRNRYGIGEPASGVPADPRGLSVLFMPLLGFDAAGTRLGAGHGYFDRLLHFRRHRHSWRRPLLVGLAFARQQLASIERHPHDVPLDAVVTEAGIHFFIGACRDEALAAED